MRQYAVLKNVARGVNFGIVVKSENVYKFFGWSEKGIEWSQWANKNSAGIDSLPDGISIGEFKSMPEEMMQSIVVSAEEARAAGQLSVERKVLVFHDGSERFSTATRLPSVIDVPLSGDIKKKQIAVNLKVKSFQAGVARSEIALNVRFNNLAFNNDVKQFVGRPNRSSRSYSRSVISSKISRGSERRFGTKIIDAINDEIIQTQLGFGFQRKIIGTKTANIFDYHVKARLGRTIGRALVPNRGRGNTRGALRAGMRSTREITGVLDPMKRRDIDGDGMIFDGTWREMPDPSRFSGIRPYDGSGRYTERENRRRRLEGMGLSSSSRSGSSLTQRDSDRMLADEIRRQETWKPYGTESLISPAGRAKREARRRELARMSDAEVIAERERRSREPLETALGRLREVEQRIREYEQRPRRELTPLDSRIMGRSDSRPGLRSERPPRFFNRGDGNDPRKIARDTTLSMLAGGADGDTAIRRVARTLGITDKNTIERLSRLNYEVADRIDDKYLNIRRLVDGSFNLPEEQRDAIVAALEEVKNTLRRQRPLDRRLRTTREPNDLRTVNSYWMRKIAREETLSMLAGGADGDSTMKRVARTLGIKDRKMIEKLSRLNYEVAEKFDDDSFDIRKAVNRSVTLPEEQRNSIIDALEEVRSIVRVNDRARRLRGESGSGLRSTRGGGNDPRTIARDTTIDMLAGGADGDSAIRRVARTLGITDKDTIDELSRLNYDVADRADDDSLDIGKLVDSSVKLPAKQRNAIVDALDEVAKTVRNVRNESNDPRTIARTIARDATIDTLAGGGDGDSAIRQVARSLGIKDKNTIDKLSALNYDVADRADEDGLDIGKLVDSSVDLPKNQRSAIVDALDEVAKTVRKEYGGSKNRLRSTRGNQVDLGLRSQTAPPTPNPRLLPVQRAVTKPDGKYFTKGEIKNLDNESLMNLMSNLFLPQEGKTPREQLDILNIVSARNVSELRDFAAREFVRRSMAKSLSKDGDEKFAKRVSKMETALKEPGSAGTDTKGNKKTIWNEALTNIEVDKDVDRDERSLPNGRTRISLDNQPRRDGGAPDLTTRSVASLRSQRAGMRSETPGSARRATAAIDRAKQPRGLSSKRSERRESAKKSALSFNELRKILGRKKVADTDGDAYKSMTDTQRRLVKAAVDKQKEENDDQIKAIFKGWWAGQVRGAKKQSARGAKQRARGTGGRYQGRPESDPLTLQDIQDLVGYLDRAISKGDVQKFKVDKDGNYVLDEDGNIELSPQYIKAQRALDDALTMLAMQDSDNYELLEHLHSARRKKVAAEIEKNAKFAGDNSALPSILKSPKLSTAADYAGGEGKKKPETDVEAFEKAAGKASLAQRILRMSPEREKRIQLRAQRRQRKLGRSGIVLDPEKQLKRRKLRAAAFRRNLISKFRKEKNPEVLSDELGARRNELHPVQIAPDGTVTLTPEFTKIIGALDASFTNKSRDRDNDQLLSDLWENLGYSETPVLVTEAEVKKLVEAGWQPIIRGTGSSEVESESYVEQFLTSEGRFIPGRGQRAFGVGEYFAYPGGNWTGYSGNPEVDRHSMLVLLPPSATIMTQFQLSSEQKAMRTLTEMVSNAFKVAGGRDAIQKMEAGEIAQEIRRAAPEIDKSDSRSAKILSELTKRLEEIDALPKTDELIQEKQDIVDSFHYLSRVSRATDSGYFAPIIGVDAIDANDGAGTGSPVLLHNRSITAAFQRPMTRNDAEAMVAGTRKVWTKWQRKPRIADDDENQAPSPRPSRTRVGRRARPPRQAPSNETSRPSSPTAQPTPGVGGPVSTTGWTRSQPQSTGSNPATLLTAPDGTQYYTKLRKNSESVAEARERMETEVLASELYKLAGVPSADLQLGDDNGQPQMLSRIIQARMPNSRADSDAARDGFVVDAWLANWDAPLNDNIKFDSNGNPVRLDVGGSLDYRARGAKKGSDGSRPFGDTVGEIISLQKSGSVNFGNMDPKEIKRQAQQLSNVTDASIRQLVSKIVSDPARAAKLAQTLINRRNYIVTNYG